MAVLLLFSALLLYTAMMTRSVVLTQQQIADHLDYLQAKSIAESGCLYMLSFGVTVPVISTDSEVLEGISYGEKLVLWGYEVSVVQQGPFYVGLVETENGIKALKRVALPSGS